MEDGKTAVGGRSGEQGLGLARMGRLVKARGSAKAVKKVKKLEKVTVLVLMGGVSSERAVSLVSGRAVTAALSGRGHRVLEGDVGPDDLSVLDGGGYDVVFPALHGAFGEDGQLQRILEERGICYVGSDAVSSRLAMDKQAAKREFARAGLLTPKGGLIEATKQGWWSEDEMYRRIGEVVEAVGVPCVVKPNREGSSIGVVICREAGAARKAAAETVGKYGECLVEAFVAGRELTVGILGKRALPVLEVRVGGGFYDYRAKYEDGQTEYVFDIGLSEEELRGVQADAEGAFSALGCRDFGRVDVIRDAEGGNYILEVNTIPGFTDHSLLPKAAGRAGWSMGEMCEEIVRMALGRTIKKKALGSRL